MTTAGTTYGVTATATTSGFSGFAGTIDKSTKSLEKLKKEFDSIKKSSKAVIDSFKGMKNEIAKFAGIVGAGFGIVNSIKEVNKYSKSIIQLTNQFAKFGIKANEVRKRLDSLSDSLSLTREDLAGMLSQLERALPSGNLKHAEKIIKNIQKVTGSNTKDMGKYLGVLNEIFKNYTDVQGMIARLNEGDKQHIINLAITANLSREQIKLVEEYVAGARLGLETEKGRIATMEQLRAEYEKIAIIIGDGLLPLFKEISDYIKNNRDGIRDTVQAVADWAVPLAKVVIAYKAIAASCKMIAATSGVISAGLKGVAVLAAVWAGWEVGTFLGSEEGLGISKSIGDLVLGIFESFEDPKTRKKNKEAASIAKGFYADEKKKALIDELTEFDRPDPSAPYVGPLTPLMKRRRADKERNDELINLGIQMKKRKTQVAAQAGRVGVLGEWAAVTGGTGAVGAAIEDVNKSRIEEIKLINKALKLRREQAKTLTGEAQIEAIGRVTELEKEREKIALDIYKTQKLTFDLATKYAQANLSIVTASMSSYNKMINAMRATGNIDLGLLNQSDSFIRERAEKASAALRRAITKGTTLLKGKKGKGEVEEALGFLGPKARERYKITGNIDLLWGQIQEKILESNANLLDQKKILIDLDIAASKRWDTEKQIASLEAERANMYVQLMDNFAVGIGASAQMRMQYIEALGIQSDFITKAINDLKSRAAHRNKEKGAIAEVLRLENERLSIQMKQIDAAKVLRDGWMESIQAQVNASGRFTKIVIDQSKNLAFGLRVAGMLTSYLSGNVQWGQGFRGQTFGERFMAHPGGAIGIQNARSGIDYQVSAGGLPPGALQGALLGSRRSLQNVANAQQQNIRSMIKNNPGAFSSDAVFGTPGGEAYQAAMIGGGLPGNPGAGKFTSRGAGGWGGSGACINFNNCDFVAEDINALVDKIAAKIFNTLGQTTTPGGGMGSSTAGGS